MLWLLSGIVHKYIDGIIYANGGCSSLVFSLGITFVLGLQVIHVYQKIIQSSPSNTYPTAIYVADCAQNKAFHCISVHGVS